jgi:antitoxin MazE
MLIIMKAIVKKWGNSLGLRFPKVYAEETGIYDGSKVDIRVSKGRLIIEPIQEDIQTLEELLKSVTRENIHNEIATDSIGEEIW